MSEVLRGSKTLDDPAATWTLADRRLPERLGSTAYAALSGDLWAGRGFYENSLKRDHHRVHRTLRRRAAGPDFSTTSIRCFEVMLELATAVPLWVGYNERDLLADRLPALLKFDPRRADPIHPDVRGDAAPATLRRSLYVAALVKASAWGPKPKLTQGRNEDLKEVQARIEARLAAQARHLVDSTIEPATHAYILYSLVRALDLTRSHYESTGNNDSLEQIASAAQEAISQAWATVTGEVEERLAKDHLRLTGPASSVELAFYAATAAVVGPRARRYLDACLDACLGTPEQGAGWPQGRVVALAPRDQRGYHLAVPAAEVDTAVAEATLRTFVDREPPTNQAPEAIDATVAALHRTEHAVVETTDGSSRGWRADRQHQGEVVDSWATAAVLAFALCSQELAHRIERRQLLDEFDAANPLDPNWPTWLEWDTYYTSNEPERDVQILDFINREIVEPRRSGPGRVRSDPVVVLLFGPPGTTKTTIARSVAHGLSWPLVSLSPGNFIGSGLERLEEQAEKVFDKLRGLSQAVVILDECDELFRARTPQETPDIDLMRTGAAFMTASMLPKLQDLHDRGRVVVFICTNFLDQMDSAMRRIGRIDHIIAVGPPDPDGRRRIIRTELDWERLKLSDHPYLGRAVSQLVRSTNNFIRGELVAAARELWEARPFEGRQDAEQKARQIAARMRDSTSVALNEKLFEQFLKDKTNLSEPHRVLSDRGEDHDAG